MKRDKQVKKMIFFFLTPAVLFFLLVFLYPVIRTIAMSFFYVEGVCDATNTWRFIGLENYIMLMKTAIFKESIMNMLKIWLWGGLITMSISMLFAVILTSGVKFKEVYKVIIYIPNIINAVAISTMWISAIYNKRFGFLHKFFELIGSDLAKTDYMSGSIKFWTLLVAFCFGSVGYYMLILISGIERIPSDIYEAATIDGASKPAQFRRITLPLLVSVIKNCIVFWTVGVVGFFVWSQMWSAPLPSELTTITPFVYMYNITFGTTGNANRNAAMGAAVGVLMALTVLFVFFAVNCFIKDEDAEF